MMTRVGDWVYTDWTLIPDEDVFSMARVGLPEDFGIDGLVAVFIACDHKLNPEPMCYVDAAQRIDGEWVDCDGEDVDVDEGGVHRRVVAWTVFPALQFN